MNGPTAQAQDIFLISCESGEVLSVALAIDCHDREVFAWTASLWPLNGGGIRTLMDKALWARFGQINKKFGQRFDKKAAEVRSMASRGRSLKK